MAKNFIERFKKLAQEISQPQISFQRLQELQAESRQLIQERMDEWWWHHNYLRQIRMPHLPHLNIPLWKHRGRRLHLTLHWQYIVSAPFIYGMIVPAVIWHLAIEIYQQVCFRLYGIPLVNRGQYFVYDRQLLSWLNPLEKINCLYCSYVNNLIRYSAEIGGRTERYWCPIKYYRCINHAHSQYEKFLAKADRPQFREDWQELRDFSDLANEKPKAALRPLESQH